MTVLARASRSNSLCALCLDLNVDCHRLTNARNRFSRWSKHQVELAPVDWIRGHRPSSLCCFVNRGQQFYVQRDRSGHAVHRKVAEDVATLRTSLLDAAALKRDTGELLRVKELRAAEMIVAFFYPCIDAAYVDLRRDRGVLQMFPIDFDLSAEVRKLAASRTQELVHAETDRRSGWIELVRVLGRCDGR